MNASTPGGAPWMDSDIPGVPAARPQPAPAVPWTAKDEHRRATVARELQALDARRNLAYGEVEKALEAAGIPRVHAGQAIAYAERIRDALEAFDSGIRPQGV